MEMDRSSVPAIVAVATPEGRGGLSLIRISGDQSRDILHRIFVPFTTGRKSIQSWTLRSGTIRDPASGDAIDEVIVSYFKAPRSYTGEDCVEISCHGNPVIADAICRLIMKCGAVPASPGEFTRRAFDNGRIDLGRAEAVALMTAAESRAALNLAMKMLRGGLSTPIRKLRNALLHILTAIELDLDFPEEPASIAEETVLATLKKTMETLSQLQAAGLRGDEMRSGRDIVLAGRVNAGKSSVFNRLMARDRAIVSSEPGTTRDTLEAYPEWDDFKVTLIDTAGLRQTGSIAESMAIERTNQSLKHADLVVYIVDGARPDIPLLEDVSEAVPNTRIIVFWNKTDISDTQPPDLCSRLSRLNNVRDVLTGSARTGASIGILRQSITAQIRAMETGSDANALMINLRQKQALSMAAKALEDAKAVFVAGDGPECAVPFLKEADYQLGGIIGDTLSPDILGNIFSSFCIGK